MTIVRDDYANNPKRVYLQTTNGCEMFAVYDGNNDFEISMREESEESWCFSRQDLREAIKYFERLIEILDKGQH